MSSLKTDILRNLSNIPGWRTPRKLLVIESDDWGSIRMPSKEIFDGLSRQGIDFQSDGGYVFNKFDSLETGDDLQYLYEILSSAKDSNGRSAVFTPAAVVANPDFKAIGESGFNEYVYEPFTKTYDRYPGCNNSFRLWKEGIDNAIFLPQFHGREHLNVKVWMRALKAGHQKTRVAFDSGFWGISTANDPGIKVEFQAAFDFIDPGDLSYQKEVIVSGLNLFEKLFGYRATFFVPPNGPFSSSLEPTCSKDGILYLSTSKLQTEPLGNGRTERTFHWPGQKSKTGLRYLSRNCFFEPCVPGKDWIDSCLNEVSIAFRWNKPAVISTHRVNYIGALHKENRENGLNKLSTLLEQIIKKWPDIEFISSSELGDIISNA